MIDIDYDVARRAYTSRTWSIKWEKGFVFFFNFSEQICHLSFWHKHVRSCLKGKEEKEKEKGRDSLFRDIWQLANTCMHF